jgi:ribonuclease-3 family protein
VNSDVTPPSFPIADSLEVSQHLQARGITPDKIDTLAPNSLAYIGDAVYELYVRTHYLVPPKRIAVYHRQVVAQVRAETQATILEFLRGELTEAEQDIVRRGRNAATKHPRRLSPEIYRQATSLETLIGYLYLKNPQRLMKLLAKLDLDASQAQ